MITTDIKSNDRRKIIRKNDNPKGNEFLLLL